MRVRLQSDNLYGIKVKRHPQLGWMLARYCEDPRSNDQNSTGFFEPLVYTLAREFGIEWMGYPEISDIITLEEFEKLPKELRGKKTLERDKNL